ncbi:MAG: DUF2071 domain-containing protein [Pseudomonadota bacterium]|nr:DUF2071 domain-containing protein [Pseudomonadota bacterium]
MTPFLSGRWSNIFVQAWAVPEDLYRPFLLPDMEPDRWEGRAIAGLVALDLVDSRLFGVRVPGRTRVPEMALQLYVRDGRRRGVRTVRKFVPRPMVAGVSRLAANEPILAVPYRRAGEEHEVRYGDRTHRVAWTAVGEPALPAEGGFEQFLFNRPWMFGKHWSGLPLSLRVDHPPWRVWTDVRPRLELDPAVLFGEHWSVLAGTAPVGISVAEGSPVEVHALAGFVEGQRAPRIAEATA